MSEFHKRFDEAPWYTHLTISVGGVGGIGSWLTQLLARVGHNIYVYDDDIIESSNIGGQLYKVSSVGNRKDDHTAALALEFSNNSNIIPSGKFTKDSPVSNIMFASFDNMKYRRMMVERWFKAQKNKSERHPKEINVFIDGRMEAETAIIYIVKSPADYKRYMAEMFDDSEIPNAPCSFRATSHNPAILGGLMVAVFNNHVTNKLEGTKFREVPFKITYELPTLTFDVIR
jgi:hypothetical protein